MAISVYMTLVGAKQGPITGPATDQQNKGAIEVHAFDIQVTTPYDAATGQASGKRQHQPITIVKEVDQTSPKLWTALVTNETITSAVLKVWSSAAVPTGSETLAYTITLTNALIMSIDESLPEGSTTAMREQISFTYQKIQWTWTDGGVTATDNWNIAV